MAVGIGVGENSASVVVTELTGITLNVITVVMKIVNIVKATITAACFTIFSAILSKMIKF